MHKRVPGKKPPKNTRPPKQPQSNANFANHVPPKDDERSESKVQPKEFVSQEPTKSNENPTPNEEQPKKAEKVVNNEQPKRNENPTPNEEQPKEAKKVVNNEQPKSNGNATPKGTSFPSSPTKYSQQFIPLFTSSTEQDDTPPEPKYLLFYAIDIVMKALQLSYFDIPIHHIISSQFSFDLLNPEQESLFNFFQRCLQFYKVDYILPSQFSNERRSKFIVKENGGLNLPSRNVKYSPRAYIKIEKPDKYLLTLFYKKGDLWNKIRIINDQIYITIEQKEPKEKEFGLSFIALYSLDHK